MPKHASASRPDAPLTLLGGLTPSGFLERHWQRVLPYLPVAQRYELAAILLEAEHAQAHVS